MSETGAEPAADLADSAAEVRELRGQIREWRRGRAEKRLSEVLQDAYIGVFAVLLFGSMAVNVVLNLSAVSDDVCTTSACRTGRDLLPWVLAGGLLLLVLGLARLFGPVFAPPADVSWLLSAPPSRAALLRRRFLATLIAAAVAGVTAAAGAFALGGYAGTSLIVVVSAVATAALLVLGLAALAQARAPGALSAGRWALAFAVWLALVAQAVSVAPAIPPPAQTPRWWLATLVLLVVAALSAAVLAVRRLDRLRVLDLSPGGSLTPGLSGALASLDLALVYDVLLSFRWRRVGSVRPVRGGPLGAGALVWADLVRLRRRPGPVLVVLAAAVVPWAADATGTGRVTVLVAVLTGFLTGLPMLGSLRAITRTPSLVRALPFAPHVTRTGTVVVPLVVLVGFGLAAAPALHRALTLTWSTSVLVALAVGVGSLAAAVRWMTGRPPDYSRPLVSTPAGGVPTNLYGSVLRGFDVVLLASTPMLLTATPLGAEFSLALSVVVLSYLLRRQ